MAVSNAEKNVCQLSYDRPFNKFKLFMRVFQFAFDSRTRARARALVYSAVYLYSLAQTSAAAKCATYT